jgi:hypothetical protein
MVTSHQENGLLFWEEFKHRLGVTIPTDMQFDLSSLIPKVQNLGDLCLPFSREEIDSIVVDFPNDKAPRPDGFNGFFVKKTWHIIRDDLYKLCTDFYDHIADLKSINHSYITLVPKKDNLDT